MRVTFRSALTRHAGRRTGPVFDLASRAARQMRQTWPPIALEAELPAAAAHLDETREDILAFTTFPREAWRQI
jgi:putative transposase